MPNWCSNKAALRHDDPGMFEKLYNAVVGGRCLFGSLWPCPEELLEEPQSKPPEYYVEKYGHKDWYSWRIHNWGIKWDISLQGVAKHCLTSNTLTFRFESPWSPPIEGYEKLISLGFYVEAMYYGPGCTFAGTYKDGDHKSHQYTRAEGWVPPMSDKLKEEFDIDEDLYADEE